MKSDFYGTIEYNIKKALEQNKREREQKSIE